MQLYSSDALVLAPLAGYTDLPYRRAARRCGCRFAFTEMVDAAALVYARARTEKMLVRGEDEQWLGAQLVSNDAEQLKQAVVLLNDYQFEVIDFNLGCPVPKVAKKGAGAALGQNIPRAVEMFKIIADNSKHPVTAKIRILSETEVEPTIQLVELLEQAGAQAVTVHGRIAKRFYSGDVAFDFINQIQNAVKIPIVANGGIMGLASYRHAQQNCICSRYMIARGSMGNPWIFDELTQQESFVPPSIDELLEAMRLHVFDMLEFYGEIKGMCVARKIILDYLKGRGFNGQWRGQVGSLTSKSEFVNFLNKTPEYHSTDYWKNMQNHLEADRKLREK